MTMKRCDQGHDYDTGENTMCPVCGVGLPGPDIANIASNDDFYTQAWDEINDQNRAPNKALWAKAFAFAQGDEKRTQAKYIELRVAQLQENNDNNKRAMVIEAEKRAQAETNKRVYEEKRRKYQELKKRLQPLAIKIQSAERLEPNATNQVTTRCEPLDMRSQPKKNMPIKVPSKKKAIKPSIANGTPKTSPT